ncbi:MAG TPA: PLDc N-terminal domain-containing protein [Actinotalea caeni]|uniref:PLDc N-terminal domain-containing protein n=1 Tax=Actinotalea caeni TaxID=1348467 RepID=UPI002B4B7BC5|nr:PLDc N-terminal domain-containing protein [Actinotalea caeni]HLV57075.1 PLDc N-terminal domain-containing protein [Actinotalea caeni]
MELFVPPVYDWVWSAAVLGVLVAAVVAVVQINRTPRLSTLAQLAWTLVVLALPVLGALTWFAVRPRARATPG